MGITICDGNGTGLPTSSWEWEWMGREHLLWEWEGKGTQANGNGKDGTTIPVPCTPLVCNTYTKHLLQFKGFDIQLIVLVKGHIKSPWGAIRKKNCLQLFSKSPPPTAVNHPRMAFTFNFIHKSISLFRAWTGKIGFEARGQDLVHRF